MNQNIHNNSYMKLQFKEPACSCEPPAFSACHEKKGNSVGRKGV